ncbi:hypothetical protein [Streptomyces sp. NPDC048636]|uniref:hypothetical protein n=1 Tax=Streptomyces sp. NPDC048636 TaxID=3155762 RepID=UPI003430ABC6
MLGIVVWCAPYHAELLDFTTWPRKQKLPATSALGGSGIDGPSKKVLAWQENG